MSCAAAAVGRLSCERCPIMRWSAAQLCLHAGCGLTSCERRHTLDATAAVAVQLQPLHVALPAPMRATCALCEQPQLRGRKHVAAVAHAATHCSFEPC